VLPETVGQVLEQLAGPSAQGLRADLEEGLLLLVLACVLNEVVAFLHHRLEIFLLESQVEHGAPENGPEVHRVLCDVLRAVEKLQPEGAGLFAQEVAGVGQQGLHDPDGPVVDEVLPEVVYFAETLHGLQSDRFLGLSAETQQWVEVVFAELQAEVNEQVEALQG
jgi:hypothetical protein